MIAIAPGYGRIDSWTGSLKYELGNGLYILDYISRRDIADSIRERLINAFSFAEMVA